jgi:uncharacterized repeat protein (TIGR03803 family)
MQTHLSFGHINPIKSKKLLTGSPFTQHFTLLKSIRCCLALLFMIVSGTVVLAQDVLVGLTSTGGENGGGTAFSIKTAGSNFTVHRKFMKAGNNPQGDLIKGTDGNFYGMTPQGGSGNAGTIFKMSSTGTVTVIKHLDYTSGYSPYGSLAQGSDGNFYGMTYQGGSNSHGTIFKITPTGALTVLKSLDYTTTGGTPFGSLVKGADGNFYGMTYQGGTGSYGTIFKITPTGTLTVLKHLNGTTTGGYPYGNLVQGSDGNFYGMTSQGGTRGYGIIFKITPTGTLTVLKNLDYTTTGGSPYGSLIKSTDGNFYGMTSSGGSGGYGTAFKITPSGTFTVFGNFDYYNKGGYPRGSLSQGGDGNFYGMTNYGGTYGYGTVFKITPGATITVLRHLNTADGVNPYGSLYKNSDGYFYGMTYSGGVSNSYGTIFKISSTGSFSVLLRFPDNAWGVSPYGSLVQAKDGNFYGTAYEGGTYGQGTIYKLCPSGSFTTLRSLNGTSNGSYPKGSMVQGTDGNFYGMASSGGTNNYGTIFKMSSTGTLTVLKNLSYDTTGGSPYGSLVQGTDGNFYGMTYQGGANNSGASNSYGTIFKITSTGTFTVLKNLDYTTTGGNPYGSLVQGSDGNFYGMTYQGGASGYGIIFKITSTGTFTVLQNLDYYSTGGAPYGSLLRGTDGNFYGMTYQGGTNGYGTIFKITPTGTLTVLKNLDGTTTGIYPQGDLVQGSDGAFYGMTTSGGTYQGGTIFKITSTGALTVLRHLNPNTDGGTPYGSLAIQKASPIANAQSVTTNEDVAKAITLTATGGSPLTYTVSTAPKNGTVTGSGSAFTYKPKANYAGKDSFYFTATWGCQTSAPAKVSITVTPVNDAPVLAAIGNKTVAKGATLSFTATATDVDAGQTKTFSLVSAPTGATIGATSGAFSWTPATAGTYTFTVKVTDNGSPVLYDSETITVTVTSTAAARAITDGRVNAEEGTLSIKALPNPSANYFTIISRSNNNSPMTLKVTDATGRTIEIKSNLSANGSVRLGDNYRPGLYFTEVVQGNKHVMVKLIKLAQ